MIFDALIGGLFRRISRRVLEFPETPVELSLPHPRHGQRHMLYLHVPYCVVLCPFCHFHRVRFKKDSAERYFESLRREIQIVSNAGFLFDELYVGGGTPTVLPDDLARTIELVRLLHSPRAISVETNPDDVEDEKIECLREVGVNRLSVGVQSFDDELLREMQRIERYGSGTQIIDRLKRASGAFETINIDMIFNFPHQTEASLRKDLDILIDEVNADQVSYYPLMAASSTRRTMRETMGRVDFSRERRFFELIVDRMLGAGYLRSSAWCFSRQPGMFDEYIVKNEEYVGLGSGSFSYVHGKLFASTFSINHYIRLVAAGRPGTMQAREMSQRDQMHYYLLMRLFSGSLDLEEAEQRFQGRFQKKLRPELSLLRAIGAVRRGGDQLTLTESGAYLWVVLMREFFSGVSDLRDEMRHHIAEEHTSVP